MTLHTRQLPAALAKRKGCPIRPRLLWTSFTTARLRTRRNRSDGDLLSGASSCSPESLYDGIVAPFGRRVSWLRNDTSCYGGLRQNRNLLHANVDGLGTLEDLVEVSCNPSPGLFAIRGIRHESFRLDDSTAEHAREPCWPQLLYRAPDDSLPLARQAGYSVGVVETVGQLEA